MHAPPSRHLLARLTLRGLPTLLMLGLAVVVGGVASYRAILRHLSVRHVAAALVVAMGWWAARLARWHLLATRSMPELSWRQTVRSMLAGTISLSVPPWEARVRAASVIASENRVGLTGLAQLHTVLDIVVIGGAAAVGAFGVNALAVIGLSLALFLALIEHVRRLQWTSQGTPQRLARALAKVSSLELLGAIGLAIIAYASILLEFHLLLRACGAVDFRVALRSVPFVLLAQLLPVGVPGVGAPELTAACVLSAHGRAAEGVLATAGLFVLNRLLPCVGVRLAGRSRACAPIGAE